MSSSNPNYPLQQSQSSEPLPNLEDLYRAIGIPAVAAAAAIVSRPPTPSKAVKRDVPAILREESMLG